VTIKSSSVVSTPIGSTAFIQTFKILFKLIGVNGVEGGLATTV